MWRSESTPHSMVAGLVITLCLLAAGAAAPLVGQSTDPPFGTVLDAATGEPVEGAWVRDVATGERTFTDAEGRFTLPEAAGGEDGLSVAYVGYQETFVEPSALEAGDTIIVRLEPDPVRLEQMSVEGAQALRSERGEAVSGTVFFQLWEEPVPGVEVVLLDEERDEVDRTVTDVEGGFGFPLPDPGSYHVRAQEDGDFSALSPAIEVTEGRAEPGEVQLILPSELAQMAATCLQESGQDGARSVLVGRALDQGTGMSLSGGRILVQWEDEEGEIGRDETFADEEGRYAFCDLPGDVELTAWGSGLGQMSRAVEGLETAAGAVVRTDLEVDLGLDAGESVQVLGEEVIEGEEGLGSFVGRVVDEGTEEPIASAVVRLVEAEEEALSAMDGWFRINDVEPGEYTVEVEHVAYEDPTGVVAVPSGAEVRVDLNVSPDVVALEGVEVRARSPLEERTRTSPTGVSVIPPDEIRQAQRFGADVGRVVQRLPGVRVSSGDLFHEVCVESTRRMRSVQEQGGCPGMITTVVDGVRVFAPESFLTTLDLSEIEAIEYMRPMEAGARYGMQASQTGALVIWTRGRGPYADPARDR